MNRARKAVTGTPGGLHGPAVRHALVAWIALVVTVAVANAQPAPPDVLSVDLGMALRLADERNLDVALYIERVAETTARLRQSRTLAVPTLRVGASYGRHSGSLQEASGQLVDADRVSAFRGFGAGAVGAGAIDAAGVALDVNIADAIFQRLVAEQNQTAALAASDANRHRVLFDVATAYFELLYARTELAIATASLERANELAGVTRDYADSGEGLVADAELAAIQPLVWERRQLAATEKLDTANARLVRLLHLESDARLEPLEETIPVIEIYSAGNDIADLVAEALERRPEVGQYDALVGAAEDDLTSERYGLFIPRVSLDYSAGQFGGAPGSSVGDLSHRDDLALMLYWEFDGFGFGNRGRVEEKRSRLRQLELQQEQLDDAIVSQVRESYARVLSLGEQVEFTAMAAERAERAYTLNRERIFENEGLPLEALQAMQTLADVQLMNLDAVVGYDLAQIELHTALGNPVQPLSDRALAPEPTPRRLNLAQRGDEADGVPEQLEMGGEQSVMSFFITSEGPGRGGDLGGLAGADAHCQALAEAEYAGDHTWRAYLNTQARDGISAVNARDRIGPGPWYNAGGKLIAANLDELHDGDNRIDKDMALTEQYGTVGGVGDDVNLHDILTGSRPDGTAFPRGSDMTCSNWTSSGEGRAMVGHHDREGRDDEASSWNSAHFTAGCSQQDLASTGGAGLFYCFAID
jgi:outer membrane protein TolC